jgi:hypothetical protein
MELTHQPTNSKYPNYNDVLFADKLNSDTNQNATIKSGIKAFMLYSEGYKNASQKIWENYTGSAWEANTLVYPIIFLNRQFVELRLKEIISGLNFTVKHEYDFPKGHDLVILWNNYLDILKTFSPSYYPDPQDIKNIEKLINEFNCIDPLSFSFRYPVDKKPEMNPSLKITGIDIKTFIETMEKLYAFFDVQSDMVYALIDQTEEYISEMHSQMESYYYDNW